MITQSGIVTFITLLFFTDISLVSSSEDAVVQEILATAGRMVSAVEEINDFISETEVVYFQNGKENQRYRLTFFFKKESKFRVNFSHPFKGVTVFYKGGDEKLTVKPIKFLPLKLRFSIDNSMVKTPSGQRIDQTDVQYFIRFLFKNREGISENEHAFNEDTKWIELVFCAKDYIEGKSLEKYRVAVSKKNWFPIRIERYTFDGAPIEIIYFKKYTLNASLEDSFFLP
jgi:outer membrane lipoprotein-sorting protein